jgi:histone deacetylase 1/2
MKQPQLPALPETPQHDPDPLFIQEELYAHATQQDKTLPRTFDEAMKLPDADQWLAAAQQEMQAHDDNKTWSLVPKPLHAKVIEGRWVFTRKRGPDSVQHKARFVAKGFSQTAGVDYDETYAAVLSLSALRLIIILAVTFGWNILQRDFKTAYLNAILMIPIYMRQPAGFEKHGGGQHMVCLLHKALYGLKQAGRAWQHALFDLLRDQKYQQSKKEPCIWFKHDSDCNTITIIAIYVDDLLITGNNKSEIKRITTVMGNTFKMKDLGEIKQFLGIMAIHESNGITLTQEHYTKEIIRKFKQEDCKGASIPMAATYQHE